MRRVAVVAGFLLVVVAFVAGSQVADTRSGLIAEVTTLIAGAAAVGLLLFGLTQGRRPAQASPPETLTTTPPKVRYLNDLILGAGGLLVAATLATGLALSADAPMAFAGLVLLGPMVAGSGYLCAAFLRAPTRQWRLRPRR